MYTVSRNSKKTFCTTKFNGIFYSWLNFDQRESNYLQQNEQEAFLDDI